MLKRFGPALTLVLAACTLSGGDRNYPPLDATLSTQEARLFFGAERGPDEGRPEAIGFYSNGCLAGAEQLAETGPTWQAMRLSRNRNWGHPVLVDYLQSLSQQVANQTSWEGLYIGDMQQPRGGPMLTGHISHQSGLDADIWMLPPDRLDLTRDERESLSSISTRGARGASVGENWTAEHMEVLRLAASDPRVARIFVFTGAKVWMCENATGDRDWLRRIRPANGHHYHFHIRLTCPPGSRDCVNQDPTAAGRGVRRSPPARRRHPEPGAAGSELRAPKTTRTAGSGGSPPRLRRTAERTMRSFIGLAALTVAALPACADTAELFGALDLRLEGPGMGGFSAIEVADDGATATVVSDRAWLIEMGLERSDTGQLSGVAILAVHRLGNAANPRYLGDSEGLALSPDGPIVSYEGDMRIVQHGADGADLGRFPTLPDAEALPTNAGPEGLAIDQQGRLYTAAEGPPGGAATPVWRLDDGVWTQIASIPRSDGFSVVGLDIDDAGRLYVLERGLTIFAEFKSRLTRYAVTEDGLGPVEPVWESGPGFFGNLEGVSIWQRDGAHYATLIADDNFASFFRSEIVELQLPD